MVKGSEGVLIVAKFAVLFVAVRKPFLQALLMNIFNAA